MRTSKIRATNKDIRIYTATSMDGYKVIWIDLWGNSYCPMASSKNSAKKLAQDLRSFADWVDLRAEDYFS